MNKLRKIMYIAGLPMILIGLILIVVVMINIILNLGKEWDFSKISTLVWIALVTLSFGVIILLIMSPFVKKSEEKEYNESISLDFTSLNIEKLPKFYPVIAFDELVKVEKTGLYFIKTKKIVKYHDLKLTAIHKEFYGQKNNYIKIQVDRNKYKNFPINTYLDYSKELMYQLKENQVEVQGLETLNIKKQKSKDTSTVISKFHSSYKLLIIKAVISILLVIGSVILILNTDLDIIGYFMMMIAVMIWTNSKNTGNLLLTEQGVVLKKNFMRIEIPYDEIININITEKKMTISSPFNFIEYEPIEEIANEITKITQRNN